jgi:hypothetical protein
MMDFEERRRERSTDPLIALHYQLDRARRENQLSTVVVADGCGLVLAGAGTWAACEELAAYAPLFLGGVERGAGSRMMEMSDKVEVQQVTVDGQTLLLCSRGAAGGGVTRDEPQSRHRRGATGAGTTAMKRVAEGVARILA